MSIYITGDCHGDYRRFSTEIFPEQYTMGKSDYVIVCGDFGYWSEDLYADFCDKMVRVKTIYRQEPVYKERTSILRKMELQKIIL